MMATAETDRVGQAVRRGPPLRPAGSAKGARRVWLWLVVPVLAAGGALGCDASRPAACSRPSSRSSRG